MHGMSNKRHFILSLIPPSNCLNHQSAGIKQNQPDHDEEILNFAPHSGGNFKTYSHTRVGMSRNEVGMDIIYIFLDMQFGGVLNYVRTHSRSNRDVPTGFEPRSSGNRKIPPTF